MSGEAVVIGGGMNGLVAANYLAGAGKRTTLLEARDTLGGLCRTSAAVPGILDSAVAHTLYALDPRILRDLELARHGLKFAARDMALVGLRTDGKHSIVERDVHATARNLAIHSRADAEAWPRFRNELFQIARAMRRLWWDDDKRSSSGPVAHIRRMSAQAWLDRRFESEFLKALLLFDATEGSLSPLDAGSALMLVWRAAQEICGLQSAVATIEGGPAALVAALEAAARARGVCIRTGVRVSALLAENGKIGGVVLPSGETVAASLVLSSLSSDKTLRGLLPPGAAGLAADNTKDGAAVGAARVLLAFDGLPAFGGIAIPQAARFVMAQRCENLIDAHEAARAGRLPEELIFEFTLSPIAASAPGGPRLLNALIRPVPVSPAQGWQSMKALLAAKVLAALERHLPDAAKHLVAAEIVTPADLAMHYDMEPPARRAPARMLSGWAERARTPISNLWLCGADADVVGAVSGRAGRIAAQIALREEGQT
jgi:phytoene dehydrogenase-like protein